MLGHGEPIRVKQGERVLFHVLNGSATEMRSLALPVHTFRVVALDGNPMPNLASVPALWLGTAERISAIVEMNHPGVWILGDLDGDDRRHGMGIVVEYAGQKAKGEWIKPAPFHWNYLRFAKPGTSAPPPDETFAMTFAKDNAVEDGFNRWTINGVAYPMTGEVQPAAFHLKEGKRYRIRMRNGTTKRVDSKDRQRRGRLCPFAALLARVKGSLVCALTYRFRTLDLEIHDHRILPASNYHSFAWHIRTGVNFLMRDVRRNVNEIPGACFVTEL